MLRVLATLFTLILIVGSTTPAAGQLFEVVERGDLTDEEASSLRELVQGYGFTDLARTWIDARLEKVSASSRPDLEWIRDVDILRVEGDIDGANDANQALAKKYPRHTRAKAAELEAVQTMVATALIKDSEARYETDTAARGTLLEERDTIFREVLTMLDTNIQRLNQGVDSDPDSPEKEFQRDRWEHYRLKAIEQYVARLPYGSETAQQRWQELAALALEFVDQRFRNFGLQYEAQLIYGKSLAALGKSQEAAEAFEVVIEVEPPADPPFDPVTVRFIRWLRLQALQGSAEAWNRAGQPERAVEIFDYSQSVPRPNFPWKLDPEDPEILPFRVAMEIEEAIARMAGGVRQDGITLMQSLMVRFDSEAFRRGDPEAAEAYLLEIARGLARAVDTGVSGLPAELYYRAALGYKDRGRYDAAIRAAQLSLDAGSGIQGQEYWLAASLYEIGDNFDSLDLPEASSAAYEILSTQFLTQKDDPRFEVLLADGAQNWFAIAGELAETQGGAWTAIAKSAEGVFADLSRGQAGIALLLQKAGEEEARGRYAEAQSLYESVPYEIEIDGAMQKVDAYYRAQAGACRCMFRVADAEGRAAEVLSTVTEKLDALIERARGDRHPSGEAALRFELASARWDDDVRDRPGALAALTPLLATVTGKNPFREGALRLWITVLCATNPEDPSDAARPADAEPVLAALKQDFAQSTTVAICLYDLVEAYQGVGTEDGDRRAAELVNEYTRHPAANFAEAGPGVKLTVAEILSQGGKHAEASAILDGARDAAAENPSLQIAITYSLAKAGNNAGKHREVIEALDPFIEANETDTVGGTYDEAPYILIQRAIAHIALYEKDRTADRLTQAEQDLARGVAVLQQRRGSLLRTNQITQKFERDYWNAWLTYLQVLKAEDRCEVVINQIKTHRIQNGGKEFAPPAIQARFDQLERDCQ